MAETYKSALDRTHAAACRLNLQNYLWKEMLNCDIGPSISLPKESVITDVACGTAMWLLHVARDLPSARMDGFDIDPSQAPFRESLRENVTLSYWNIFDDVPNELVDKYDYIHVSLLILVIEDGDILSIVRKFLELLKPGGYLQRDELDCVNMCVKRVHDTIETPALDELRSLCHAGGQYDWSVEIARFLTEGGFQDAKLTLFGDSKGVTRAFNDQHMLTMEELATTLSKRGQNEMAINIHQLISAAFP